MDLVLARESRVRNVDGSIKVSVRTILASEIGARPCSENLKLDNRAKVEMVKIKCLDKSLEEFLWEIVNAFNDRYLQNVIGACYRIPDYGIGLALPWLGNIRPFAQVVLCGDLEVAYPAFKDRVFTKDRVLTIIINPGRDIGFNQAVTGLANALGELELESDVPAGYLLEPNGQRLEGGAAIGNKIVIAMPVDDYRRIGGDMAE